MRKKKIISIIVALSVLISALAIGFNAYAKSERLVLDTRISSSIDGEYDKIWYYFTPSESGTYSFLSYNTPLSEAYLMIRDVNPDGSRDYKTLAYSGSDPNYTSNAHNKNQFCLTYHLDAGVTYFYVAGWQWDNESFDVNRTSGTFTVMLRCDEYDNQAIDRVMVSCNAALSFYTDGEWRVDSNGESYFYYNYSKIIQNMTVTLVYKDGHTSSVTGGERIDGYDIIYSQDQINNHWCIASDVEHYNGNVLTISVLDKKTDYNVVIDPVALRFVYGKVVDYTTNEPVANATLSISQSNVATTGANGEFSFVIAGGSYSVEVSAANAITRTINISVDIIDDDKNDHRSTPIGIVVGDYNRDNVINGKDYAYIIRNYSGAKRTAEAERFALQANFIKNNYPQLRL